MKKYLAVLFSVLFFAVITIAFTYSPDATCKGVNPCHACKNCKYYKHCAKDSGTCGVCKK